MSGTQDRIRIQVKDPLNLLSGPWKISTGESGEYEISMGREEAGGEQVASSGPQTKGDMVIERQWNPVRDLAILEACQRGEQFAGTVITRIYLDGAYNPIPNKRSVSERLILAGYQGPEADADSAEKGMLQLTFKVP